MMSDLTDEPYAIGRYTFNGRASRRSNPARSVREDVLFFVIEC